MKKKLHPQPRGVIIDPWCRLERISSSKEVQSVKRKTSLENLFPHHFASFIYGVIHIKGQNDFAYQLEKKWNVNTPAKLLHMVTKRIHKRLGKFGWLTLGNFSSRTRLWWNLWKEYSHINTIFHSSSDREKCRWYLSSTVHHLK